MGRRKRALPAPVEALRGQLEKWRKRRSSLRERIPEALWQSAARLAREHGVHPIASALRLNYDHLKRRVSTGSETAVACQTSEPAFVELEVGQPSSEAHCVVELEDRRGAKMTIRLEGSSGVDVVGLAGAFWRKRR